MNAKMHKMFVPLTSLACLSPLTLGELLCWEKLCNSNFHAWLTSNCSLQSIRKTTTVPFFEIANTFFSSRTSAQKFARPLSKKNISTLEFLGPVFSIVWLVGEAMTNSAIGTNFFCFLFSHPLQGLILPPKRACFLQRNTANPLALPTTSPQRSYMCAAMWYRKVAFLSSAQRSEN